MIGAECKAGSSTTVRRALSLRQHFQLGRNGNSSFYPTRSVLPSHPKILKLTFTSSPIKPSSTLFCLYLVTMRNHHFIVLAVILSVADAFHTQRPVPPKTCSSALFMGRAAAVRAATKSKTDGKKAKVNGVFGKKIIMAVKQGGSPDPVANTILRDVIKAAKANSVPADVSCVSFTSRSVWT